VRGGCVSAHPACGRALAASSATSDASAD
jgi:hypothetical protein